MSLKTLFFGKPLEIHKNELGTVCKESLPGLGLVLLVGLISYLLTHARDFNLPLIPYINYIDSLVLAVFLGMLLRTALVKTKLLNTLTPGILIAPVLLIPIGVILYGSKLRLDKLAQVNVSVILLVLLTMAVSVFLIYFLSVKVFKLTKKMAFLLGIGSAVCGASAIAITSPAVQAEPDEMGAALVTNTLLAIVSLFILKAVATWVAPEIWSATAGALLQQTGFVKIAVQGELQAYAMLIKTMRVALLLIIIPLVYFLNQRKLYIPWYMVLFIAMGIYYSYGTPSKAVSKVLEGIFEISFTTALASIGMNADLLAALNRVWKALVITLVAFCLGIGIFFLGLR